MDIETQKDELVALESIYTEEEFSYCLRNDQYEITVQIFINLNEKYFFTFKEKESNTEKWKRINISYLPPLKLSVTLPVNYPSTSPPNFTLRSSWLSVFSISQLCKELDKLWEANKGQEILFIWISFLQLETLVVLKIEECISIDKIYNFYKIMLTKSQIAQPLVDAQDSESSNENNAESKEDRTVCNSRNINKAKDRIQYDQRAICDIFINASPVQMLINYNDIRAAIEFKKNIYTCKICFFDKSGTHCTQFLPCAHVFCKECITNYFEVKIKDGVVQNILCPEEKCKSEANPAQIKDLVSAELFLKYDSILLNTTLDTMTDIIYCPRKSCQYPVSQEPNEVMANCPVCQYVFCILCKAVYHGVEPCKITVEKQNLAKEYQEASKEEKVKLEQRYGKKQMQILVDTTMSENWIHSNSKQCPHCKTAIEKSDGCNKMTCWKCNTFFCWVCKLKLNRADPYGHFQDPHSQCYNMLYHGLIFEEHNGDEYFDYVVDDIDAEALFVVFDY